MRVSIVGAGYVGLVTGACLAEQGHDVVCADLDQTKVDRITAGATPIYEPGLEELLTRNAGVKLRATTDVAEAVTNSDMTLIAVGTPSDNGSIDLGAVVSATRAIGTALAKKSRLPRRRGQEHGRSGHDRSSRSAAARGVDREAGGSGFGVGVNPEFLTEGQAVSDFMASDRLVLGGIDDRTHAVLEELYRSFPTSVPRLRTDTRTAEMIKYTSNSLLATMISFANEIGNLCAAVGDVDVAEVMQGVHLSHYLSPFAPDGSRVRAPIAAFLEAGCGFGGSCLPKDVRALIAEGERREQPMRVLRAVIETNEEQPGSWFRSSRVPSTPFRPSASRYSAWRSSPTPTMCERPPRFPSCSDSLRGERGSQSTIRWCLPSRNSSEIWTSTCPQTSRAPPRRGRGRARDALEAIPRGAGASRLSESLCAVHRRPTHARPGERLQLRGHRSGLIARLVALGCGKAGQTRARHRLSR